MRTERAIARRASRDLARATAAWSAVFALMTGVSIIGYGATFGDLAARAQFAAGIEGNQALRAIFGPARNLAEVGGFTAWRTLGLLPLVGAIWGMLAGTRVLRGEEEDGRWEILLSGPTSRARATAAALAGMAANMTALLACGAITLLAVGSLGYGLPVLDSLMLAYALAALAALFCAVGAVTSQIAVTRAAASGLAAATLGATFLARVAADSSDTYGWLRWATPFGWVTEIRPYADPQPAVMLLPFSATLALAALALLLARRRDTRAGLLAARDAPARSPRLLGSPLAASIRAARGQLAGWIAGVGLTGFVFGLITKGMLEMIESQPALREHVRTLHSDEWQSFTATAYLSAMLLAIAVVVALYAASRAGRTRDEEARGRLDTLLSRPISRRRWFGGELAVAVAGIIVLEFAVGGATWAGAAIQSSGVTLPDMLRGSLNLTPVAILFLGLGTLTHGLRPRLTAAVAYGAIGVTYLWETIGVILRAPEWALALSPFHHLNPVPAVSVNVTGALAMSLIGVIAALIGVETFARRDIVSR